MSNLPPSITLGPDEESRRLWRGALDARRRSADDFVALCESLDLGLRAAEIVVVHRLQPVKDRFPATIALQLEIPTPEVEPHRDAVAQPRALQFTDVIDLLSEESLECVGPRLHRGWEDRRFACRRSRKTAQEALGVTLQSAEQESLLLLAAYRNRLFRYPPPIRVEPGAIEAAFGALDRLVTTLLGT